MSASAQRASARRRPEKAPRSARMLLNSEKPQFVFHQMDYSMSIPAAAGVLQTLLSWTLTADRSLRMFSILVPIHYPF